MCHYFLGCTVFLASSTPVLDLNTTDPSSPSSEIVFQESVGFVNILEGTTQHIVNPDSSFLGRAVITITSRPDNLSEVLRLDPLEPRQVRIVVNNALMGELLLEQTADFPTWLSILRSVQYVNTNPNPSDTALRQLMIVVHDDGGVISEPVHVNITIEPFNNPPDLFLGGPSTRNFTNNFFEGGPCIPLIAYEVHLVDEDSTGIESIRVAIRGLNFNRDFEQVLYNGTGPSGVINTTEDGVFILLDSKNTSFYEAVLRNLLYCNTEDEPNEVGGRTIIFTVVDTGLVTESGRQLPPAESALSSTTINIIRVNDPPSLLFAAADLMVTLPHGYTSVFIAPRATIADPDDRLLQNMTVALNGTLGSNALRSGNQVAHVLTFHQRTSAVFTSTLRLVEYVDTAPEASLQTIHIQVCDAFVCTNTTLAVMIEGRSTPIVLITTVVAPTTIVILLAAILLLVYFAKLRTKSQRKET